MIPSDEEFEREIRYWTMEGNHPNPKAHGERLRRRREAEKLLEQTLQAEGGRESASPALLMILGSLLRIEIRNAEANILDHIRKKPDLPQV